MVEPTHEWVNAVALVACYRPGRKPNVRLVSTTSVTLVLVLVTMAWRSSLSNLLRDMEAEEQKSRHRPVGGRWVFGAALHTRVTNLRQVAGNRFLARYIPPRRALFHAVGVKLGGGPRAFVHTKTERKANMFGSRSVACTHLNCNILGWK